MNAGQPQALADQLVLQVAQPFHDLGHGVTGADAAVELLVDGEVNVLVDGRADDGARFLLVEHGQIAAAAHEADSQRCA